MVQVRFERVLAGACTLIILSFIGKSSSFSDRSRCNTYLPQRQLNNRFLLRSFQSNRNKIILFTHRNNDCKQRHLYPWAADYANDGSVFHSKRPYYVFHPSHPIHQEYWQELCPSPPKLSDKLSSIFSSRFSTKEMPSISSVDISITWTLDEDPRNVARRIVQECLRRCIQSDDKKRISVEKYLTTSLENTLVESLRAYRDFCQTHMLRGQSIDVKAESMNACNCCTSVHPQNQKLKCRLVATRGYSGAKCPQYHIDNVPCRWIQSMVGPGVELVNTSNIDNNEGGVIRWNAFSHSPAQRGEEEMINDEDDDIVSWSVDDRNRMLVDARRADIYHSKQGEAILIPGSTWDEYSLSYSPTATKPVVHKSPEGLHSDQCRVLFTQDIVFE